MIHFLLLVGDPQRAEWVARGFVETPAPWPFVRLVGPGCPEEQK